MDEDRTYQGTLKVIANAGQHFSVRIIVDVQGNRKGWFGGRSKPAAAPAPERAPAAATGLPLPPAPTPAAAAIAPAWATATRSGAATAAPLPSPPPPPASSPILTPVGRTPSRSLPATAVPPAPPSVSAPAARVNILQAVIVGAILGLLWRLVMVFPADMFARLLRNPARSPLPGSLEAWLQMPAADETFLRSFVLATWWVGAVVGVILIWQRGGSFLDMAFGLLAGAVAGLGGSATVACALVLGDALPRGLLNALLGSRSLGPALATPLWIITTSMCWIVEGALIGLVLAILGRSGAAGLAFAASPLAWLLRLCGMASWADFFALRGE
jgi:hypothetical protein